MIFLFVAGIILIYFGSESGRAEIRKAPLVALGVGFIATFGAKLLLMAVENAWRCP